MSELGFKDPDNQYPDKEYVGQPTTNKAAREEWESYVKLPDGAAGAELVQTEFQPKYPYNKVEETSSGHRVEMDDTPGEERVSHVHMTGSGVEMYPDGTLLVNSYGRTVQLTGDDFTMIVNGNGNVTYKGNLNLNVEGDFNINCANFTVNGAGRRVEETRQDKVENYTGDRVVTTKGTRSDIVQGNRVIGSAKNTYIISGKRTKIASGDNMFIMAGDKMYVSAEDEMNLATDNMRVTGMHIAVVGDSGTIGGDNVVMYANSLHTNTVDAQLTRSDIIGNLDGDITGHSATTDFALAAQDSANGTVGTIPVINNLAAANTHRPDRDNMLEALTQTITVGVRNIDVDESRISSSVTGGVAVAYGNDIIGAEAAINRPDIYPSAVPGPEAGPATIRNNNPGAMYPNQSWQDKYNYVGMQIIGGGHQIAQFATPIDGAAAQMALLRDGKFYRDKSIKDAISAWSGGNNVDSYLNVLKQDGIDVTKAMNFYTGNKQGMVQLAQSMSRHETGSKFPLSNADWDKAYDQMIATGGM